MPAPLAKGIIIAASIVVAAGIAIYESPQVRAWLDQSRRKIALALHNLGDDIQPRRPSESSDDFDVRKRRREDLIRRNRNDLIRRAREEGVAVDLDELARIGDEELELAQRRQQPLRPDGTTKSFDNMVTSDGTLRNPTMTTGTDAADSHLRKRGAAAFVAGAGAGAGAGAATATATNPFVHDNVLFDAGDDEAPSPKDFSYVEPSSTRESTTTLHTLSPPPLIDLTPEDALAQSFYSFASSDSNTQDPLVPAQLLDDDDDVDNMSTGTLTPRSERSHSVVTGASIAGSNADDIGILSMQNDTDHDARSEIFSEGGFTDGFSETAFSELGDNDRVGIMTPNSWTDVGSDDESDWGGVQQNGHVSQIHQ
ncbi:hypothetical protein ACEQ8H_008258 [Pleosporales sp. CAS-2024a]